MRKVVIIGSGPAGYTAAVYAARANLAPILFSGAAAGGQLMITSDVENFPGFPEPILGPELMDRMMRQCKRLGVEMVAEDVARVDLKNPPFLLETTEGKKEEALTLILATGSDANWLGLESEKRLRGHGVSACATCDGFFFKNKRVCVAGGGDTALEEGIFLTHFASEVALIHRRDKLRAGKTLQDRAFKNPKIKFVWNSTVEEILGKDTVEGVRIKNTADGKTQTLPCEGFFVAIGHTPNTRLFRGQLELDEKGCIRTNGRTRTSVPGVFAAGDVMDPLYRQAVTAAGTGCMAALEAERFLETLK